MAIDWTKAHSDKWQEIRSRYVNGAVLEAVDTLYQLPKYKLLGVISAALETHYRYLDHPEGTTSNDLQDLREMLRDYNLEGK